jgi:acetyltransferase-like isoleucine patch superfamily enzyme
MPEPERGLGPDPWLPAYVEIGDHTYYMKGQVHFSAFIPGEKIRIGRYCSIAPEARFCVGGNHRTDTVSTYPFDNLWLARENPTRTYETTRDTEVGSDVWIGWGAHIGAGVKIGHGAVVASRAVVFTDVPPYAVVVGNPARVMRYRFSEPIVEALLRVAWWDWPSEVVRERVEWFYRPVAEFVAQFDSGPTGPK